MKLISRNIAVLLLLASGLAMAESESQMIKPISGEISVDANGVVKAVVLKNSKEDKVDKFVIDRIKSWSFFPMEINSKPVEVTTGFNVNLIATFGEDKKLKQLEFNDLMVQPSALEFEIKKKRGLKQGDVAAISYPDKAARIGAEATITLALDINADGKVRNADVFEIELINADARDGKILAKAFGDNALNGARLREFSKDELAYELANGICINGCIATYKVYFRIQPNFKNGPSVFSKALDVAWKAYLKMPVASIPWVIADQTKEISEVEQSQLV